MKAKTNLRSGGPRFIGRTAELAQLDAIYAEGDRLVTVFGPPGIGKTRLAEAYAQRVVPELTGLGSGGVWMCELSNERDTEGVCAALGRTLGVPPHAGTPVETVGRVGDALAARGPILVVFDNFEQLAHIAAETVGTWLAAAPDARFLVTSRTHLHLRDEVGFELPALTLPGPGVDVRSSEAVQLFVDRVRSVDTAFALADTNAEVVAELVRRLEGIPLAIELAACRVDLVGIAGLLERLDERIHVTLRRALDWSWGLLDEDERRVLATCAVFRAGFSAEAARVVVHVPGSRPVLSIVQSLRDASLLRRLEPEAHAGRTRYALFESVREFAEEQLVATGGLEAARRKHADYYLAAGETWAAQVGRHGPEMSLALERDNLLAMHAFALERIESESDALERSVRAVLLLDVLAAVRGPFGHHLDLLDRTLAAAQERTLAPVARARLLHARGRTRALHGQTTAAQRDFDAALAIATMAKAAALQAELSLDVAVHAHPRRHEMDTALAPYKHALGLARAADVRAVEGRALGNLGALHHDLGHFAEARASYRNAVVVIHEVGDRRIEAIHLAKLAIIEQEGGAFAQARSHFLEADEISAELGDRRLQAMVIGNLGTLEHEEGHPERARSCHERALAMLREVGDRRSEALCLGRLARADAALAWIEDALTCLSAADRLAKRYDDPLARASVELSRGFVDMAWARYAMRNEDPAGRATSVGEARARIAKASERGDAALSWIERSDDIRAAVRILERDLERLGEVVPLVLARPALMLGPEAKWFQVPGEEAQDLRRRTALRAILWALAQRHRDDPGSGLSLEDIVEIGWPGEGVSPSAGANRVYVALTTLRSLGLRGYLISQSDGYLLDPALPMERVSYEQPS